MARGRSRSLERRAKRLDIVVVEGDTEDWYFSALRHARPRSSTVDPHPTGIKVENAGGHSPLHVVRFAIEKFQKYGKPSKHVRYFAVFDTEWPDVNKQQSVADALKLARSKRVHCVLSHPCFEVWFHCHLNQFRPRAFVDASDCCAQLSTGWHNEGLSTVGFVKPQADAFEQSRHRLDQAVQSAAALRELHSSKLGITQASNAFTDVHKLIQHLQGKSRLPSP